MLRCTLTFNTFYKLYVLIPTCCSVLCSGSRLHVSFVLLSMFGFPSFVFSFSLSCRCSFRRQTHSSTCLLRYLYIVFAVKFWLLSIYCVCYFVIFELLNCMSSSTSFGMPCIFGIYLSFSPFSFHCEFFIYFILQLLNLPK